MCKYAPEKVAATVDLACLKPDATSVDVSLCCQTAVQYGCASVCVKPYHVPIAARLLENEAVSVGTVISFPHGSDSPGRKALACYDLINAGAKELDMVLNIAAIKDGDWQVIVDEIGGAAGVCGKHSVLLKVILETCYLEASEIVFACIHAMQNGANFVKTSTGFGPGNATPGAVRLMVEAVGLKGQVKASGGIKTYDDAELYLDLGCTRLGSSRIAELMPYDLEGE